MNKEQIQQLIRTYGGWLLLIIHTVGVVLLGGDWRDTYVFLTPVNLFILALLYFFASEVPKSLALYFMPALMGWFVELIGTNTGLPFGEYTYSSILGPGFFGTPLMIGVLWWVLIRSAYDLLDYFTSSKFYKSIFTGLSMVSLDFLIEPVAIKLNFWQWTESEVPLENYLAWFFCSALFARVTANGTAKNPLSSWIWISLLVFFGALNLIY
jgi:bisanhydrobacterioruberin hydratase|tara:strand:+ start:221 stop:853 length:633 start_codon:yes stop_codon:yes gene_type:complete